MQLTHTDYINVLSAVEELASKQMSTDIDSYRREVLSVLSEILGFNRSLFWLVDDQQHLVDPILLNIDKKSLEEYNHYFYQLDILGPFYRRNKQQIQQIEDVTSFNEYLHSEYYHSFMKKYAFLDEMGIYLKYDGALIGVIGLLRDQDEEKFTEKDKVKLNFLFKQIEIGFNLKSIYPGNRTMINSPLTSREKELVAYLEMGMTNKEIAKKLYVSDHTVKKHLHNLYRKYEVSNRTELLYKIPRTLL
ncbi:regulatory LuxR family protein [Aneurinibacillus soli]|uniref:CsgBAC operon transcriptional regulatory protein n=1 Tax=Aneurinibacillus soli TaxID=1500254 RepID=A0A0U4WGC9_9BACL|nr:helix-turn-helix transcriptional regulator [Aneurinibacillus soli]PYE61400.1 regulatory LuxR family protein [Aneurinibacillus soli]BAU27771.1 CsgBAC operon transcriptional regulatory protein [Aneurinibacillus soli]